MAHWCFLLADQQVTLSTPGDFSQPYCPSAVTTGWKMCPYAHMFFCYGALLSSLYFLEMRIPLHWLPFMACTLIPCSQVSPGTQKRRTEFRALPRAAATMQALPPSQLTHVGCLVVSSLHQNEGREAEEMAVLPWLHLVRLTKIVLAAAQLKGERQCIMASICTYIRTIDESARNRRPYLESYITIDPSRRRRDLHTHTQNNTATTTNHFLFSISFCFSISLQHSLRTITS
jgi:hypothetical protein